MRKPPLLILAIALAACSAHEAPQTGPTPGVLTATLVSPAGAEGAAIVDVTGNISTISPVTGRVFTNQRGDTTRVIVVRTDAGDIRFRFTLRDLAVPLSARVVEIAGADNALRSNLSSYSIRFANDGTP